MKRGRFGWPQEAPTLQICRQIWPILHNGFYTTVFLPVILAVTVGIFNPKDTKILNQKSKFKEMNDNNNFGYPYPFNEENLINNRAVYALFEAYCKTENQAHKSILFKCAEIVATLDLKNSSEFEEIIRNEEQEKDEKVKNMMKFIEDCQNRISFTDDSPTGDNSK